MKKHRPERAERLSEASRTEFGGKAGTVTSAKKAGKTKDHGCLSEPSSKRRRFLNSDIGGGQVTLTLGRASEGSKVKRGWGGRDPGYRPA